MGAENRDGSSGKEVATPSSDTAPSINGYEITAGTPTAGGTVAIDYDVLGKHVGNSNLRALMTSDQIVGSAKIVTNFHVTH